MHASVDLFQTTLIHRLSIAFTAIPPTQDSRVFTSDEAGLGPGGVPTLLTLQEYPPLELPLRSTASAQPNSLCYSFFG